MSVREIAGHVRELYGIDVSPDLISAVTDAVLEELAAWQARPLEAVYPLIFFDALRVKIRGEGTVRNKAVHIALGVVPSVAHLESASTRFSFAIAIAIPQHFHFRPASINKWALPN
jgi:Transposase, Mutator family